MREIGEVPYSEAAFEHMRRIAEQTCVEPSQRDGKTALLNEAEVIHAFHESFPGLTWSEPEARPSPDENRVGKFQRPGAASATQREAAIMVMPRTGTARREVLDYIVTAGNPGATDEEIQDALAMNPSTQRPRRVELVEGGWIRDSGRTRTTRSGTRAVVWVMAQEEGS